MNRHTLFKPGYKGRTILLAVFFSVLLTSAFAQQKVCFFKYSACPDKRNGNKLNFGPRLQTEFTTRVDYSDANQITFIYAYGTKRATAETYKRVTNNLFNKEPKEISGHRLLGAYFNPGLAMYELYYLSSNHQSMLHKTFAHPGKLFWYEYLSNSRTCHPFENMVLRVFMNDTIQLRTQPAPKQKNLK
ncbi:hypothetical protein A3860_09155 [Niastella vici]|uniref:Uncharacterized protein n=1 Tax=Niastella vici TaxID=1703345 RepID=A0A1V9FHE8_9BACT|nr:hypothetical protein [Niastella vici]OQP57784.1 hypothetical protein A3860_09155 [Niastella vici]